MTRSEQFPYVEIDPTLGPAGALPYLSLTLERDGNEITVSALVDSGSAVNVLPFDIGEKLGAIWDQQTVPVELTGNLAGSEARALLVNGMIGSLPTVRLAFAWTKSNDVPVLLGQVNFFIEFDVCFCRSHLVFEIGMPDPTAPGSA